MFLQHPGVLAADPPFLPHVVEAHPLGASAVDMELSAARKGLSEAESGYTAAQEHADACLGQLWQAQESAAKTGEVVEWYTAAAAGAREQAAAARALAEGTSSEARESYAIFVEATTAQDEVQRQVEQHEGVLALAGQARTECEEAEAAHTMLADYARAEEMAAMLEVRSATQALLARAEQTQADVARCLQPTAPATPAVLRVAADQKSMLASALEKLQAQKESTSRRVEAEAKLQEVRAGLERAAIEEHVARAALSSLLAQLEDTRRLREECERMSALCTQKHLTAQCELQTKETEEEELVRMHEDLVVSLATSDMAVEAGAAVCDAAQTDCAAADVNLEVAHQRLFNAQRTTSKPVGAPTWRGPL